MALERIDAFCDEFKPSNILVFIPIIDKLELSSHIEKYSKDSLQEAYKPITVFIADHKKGFPHGGASTGGPKPITEVLRYLVTILSRMTLVLESIYKKMDYKILKSRSYYGYPKKWVKIEDQFVTAYEHWGELIEPVTTMVASTHRTRGWHKPAQSRVVNTLNRFNKHLKLPTAQAVNVTQNYYEENIPMGRVVRLSLSPTLKSKRSKRHNRTKSIRMSPKGIRI